MPNIAGAGEPHNEAPGFVTGVPSFSKQIIDNTMKETHFAVPGDFDLDGDTDVVATNYLDDTVAWYENNGSGGFTKHVIDSNLDGAYPAHVADLNRDGALDVLATGYLADMIVWYENNGAGVFTRRIIDENINGAHSVYATDIDRDNDTDVVAANQDANTIVWYENDGSSNFIYHLIDSTAIGAKYAFAADLDGDNDIDIARASFFDKVISWYENDGQQNFNEISIDTQADGAYYVTGADLDGDGDTDLVSASQNDNTIAWYENNGLGGFTKRVINYGAAGVRAVFADDGDTDVLSASVNDDTIAWYRNDGKGIFIKQPIDISTGGAYGVSTGNIDGDGQIDVIAASRDDYTIAIYHQIRVHRASLAMGSTLVISSSLLRATDVDNTPAELIYTVTDFPDSGELRRNGARLARSGTFTQADVNNKLVSYVHNGANANSDSFAFTLIDGGQDGVRPGSGTFNLNIETTPLTKVRSDDFNTSSINQSLWTFVNPLGDAILTMTGTQASIAVPAGTSHDIWNGNPAPRIMQNVSNADFDVEAKFESAMNSQYQVQGLLVQQDANNFLRFDFVRDASNTRIFAASFKGGSPSVRSDIVIPHGSPLYIRVNRQGDQWTQSYSYDGEVFMNAAIFNHVLTVSSIGFYAANHGVPASSSPAFTGLVDYFFNTASPIVPEDGGNYQDPGISKQPLSRKIEVGGMATFSVEATGTMPLSYQWQKNGTNIPGATGASYTTPPATMSDNGSTYRVNVTNPVGSVMSDSAILLVSSVMAPTIITQPSNQSVAAGQNATFSVLAEGTSPLSYQWQKNGTNIPGATRSSYTTPATSMSDNGSTYRVNVTNSAGSVMSDQAKLAIRPPFTLLSDDFSAQVLDTSLWTIVNPRNDATITLIGNGTPDAMLSIAVPGGQEHDVWAGNNAPRVMQSISNTNFEIELKFQSQLASGYQMQGVIIQQDSNNYLRFDFVRFPGSTNVFAASFAAGSPTTRYNVPIASGNPLYMRINRTGEQWKQFYSFDGTNWILAANFNYPMIVSSVGPFAGNALGSSSPAFTGLIDYFFDTSSPIVSEDGGNFNDLNISIQPMNQEVEVGGTASFSVVATGTAPLSYQWQKNGTNIPGATSASYTTPLTDISYNRSTYRVRVSNAAGSVLSNSATLTVLQSVTPPTITIQPFNQTVTIGQNATFSVVATGSLPLSYQWKKNGTNIPGATSSSYTTPATIIYDNGSTYRVNITNPAGSVMSDLATLTVRTPLTIISDDFNSLTLNSSLWIIIDPKNDSKFTLIGNGTPNALLSITVPAGISHDAWTGTNYAPRIMQSVNNTNFEIEVKFQSQMTSQYQIQGLIIQEDGNNYIRFDFVRNSATTNIFAASFTAGNPTVKYNLGITTRTPLYLRINRTGDQWKQFYSNNGIDWISAANFNHVLKVTSVGPFVGNHGIPETNSPAFTGLIDYFFNTTSPVIPEDVPDNTSPIDLWYGNTQSFGQIGVPQQWINILGNAHNEYGIATMNYSLNNGSVSNLSLGPESYRLTSIGDFNIEINRTDLLCGDNRVAINATDNAGNTKREIVFINYSCNNVWPGNYNINWSNVTRIQDVAQVVDGLWTKESNSIRPTIIGYDRLINIGDLTWDDYEITVPVTLNAPLDPSAPHAGPNFGVGMRWQGHYTWAGNQQPREGWYPLGALGVYIWVPEVNDFRLRILGNGMYVIANDNSGRHLNVGVPYMFKMRAQTIGTNTLYSLKVWEKNANEPTAWTISGYGGYAELKQGSTLLNSHYANVSYGNVSIKPGPFENELAISDVSVEVNVNSATVSWITSKQASSNVSYGLSTAYQNGSVVDGTMVFSHTILLAGLKPGTNYHYKIKSTDILGNSSSTEDMNFTTMPVVNLTSIVSDDYNTPTLNTSLWTVVDPKGDATITIIGNGTSDALLSIAVPAGQEHDVWQGNYAPRVMQSISNTNFEIELKFQSQPTSAYQIQGVIIQQDSKNYLRFDFVRFPTTTNVFAASFAGGLPTTRYNVAITSGNPMYLRVNRTGNVWKQFYSFDGTNWKAAANFSYPLIVSSVGPFAGNALGSSSPAFIGLVDYFFNTSSPVVPEDTSR